MPSRKLILIKHAAPQVMPSIPSEEWALSDEGKHRCVALADAVLPFQPASVISSVEPKAAETAELIAARLGVPCETAEGLHEQDRSNVPHMPTREFISMVELFFRRPRELVLGRESAARACRRFEDALGRVLESHPEGNVAVVSHGVVISLYLEERGGGNGFTLWRRLGLPSLAVIDLDTQGIDVMIDRIG